LLKCAKIAKKHIEKTGKPVGINCKGGVGRTGVLATVVYGMQHIDEQLADGKKFNDISINLAELNYDLRRERRGLVSHSGQFVQVHKALGNYARTIK
jgi:protein tyrosine phosphatase